MFLSVFIPFIFVSIACGASNEIYFRGTVLDLGMKPAEGAVVYLAKEKMRDTVDSDGMFLLSTGTAADIQCTIHHKPISECQEKRRFLYSDTQKHILSAPAFSTPKPSVAEKLYVKLFPKLSWLFTNNRWHARPFNTYMLSQLQEQRKDTYLLKSNQNSCQSHHMNTNSSAPISSVKQNLRSVPIDDTLIVIKNNRIQWKKAVNCSVDTTINIILETVPDVFIDKIDAFPDYYQRDRDFGGFPDKGRVYCGPTATANAIVWLAENGFPFLSSRSGDAKKDQHEIIASLGSSTYMNVIEGVGPWGVCDGLKRYIMDKGYTYDSLRSQGWRAVAPEFQTGVIKPDLNWIKRGILHNNIVLANFGWYSYDKDKDEYRRVGGHWMTIVGYGHNGKEKDSLSLVVHDPATRWVSNEYRTLEKITSGVLKGSRQMPSDAIGLYRYKTGWNRYGILDAVVMLSMGEQQPKKSVSRY